MQYAGISECRPCLVAFMEVHLHVKRRLPRKQQDKACICVPACFSRHHPSTAPSSTPSPVPQAARLGLGSSTRLLEDPPGPPNLDSCS
jgi:hypothetical protein